MEDPDILRAVAQTLQSRRKELLGRIRQVLIQNDDVSARMQFEMAQDNPDRSVDELLKYVSAEVRGAMTEELDAIEAALRKIAEGSYGVCDECGCQIPPRRLAVQPTAFLCVDCQQEFDATRDRTVLSRDARECIRPPDDPDSLTGE